MALRYFFSFTGMSSVGFSEDDYTRNFASGSSSTVSIPSDNGCFTIENYSRELNQQSYSSLKTYDTASISQYNSLFLVEQSFLRTETIRLALDFKLSQSLGSQTPSYIFTVNNVFSGLSRNVAEPPTSQTFVYLIYNRATDSFELKQESTVLASITEFTESELLAGGVSDFVHIEAEINVANGTVKVWVSNTNYIDITGVDFSGTSGDINSISFAGGSYQITDAYAIWGDTQPTGNELFAGYVGDYIVDTIIPQSSFSSGHTSGSVSRVDDLNYDSNAGLTFTVDQSETIFNFENLRTPAATDILAVVAKPWVEQGVAGSGVQVGVDTNAAMYYGPISDRVKNMTTSRYVPLDTIFELNPATGLPWTETEINDAKFSFKVHTPA